MYERFNFYFTRDLPYILLLIYTRTHVKKKLRYSGGIRVCLKMDISLPSTPIGWKW